jgi:hypothetical protein
VRQPAPCSDKEEVRGWNPRAPTTICLHHEPSSTATSVAAIDAGHDGGVRRRDGPARALRGSSAFCGSAQIGRVVLEPLPVAETTALVASLIGPGAGGLGPVIVDRAEGNPFYAEQSVRLLADAGGIRVPASVRGRPRRPPRRPGRGGQGPARRRGGRRRDLLGRGAGGGAAGAALQGRGPAPSSRTGCDSRRTARSASSLVLWMRKASWRPPTVRALSAPT